MSRPSTGAFAGSLFYCLLPAAAHAAVTISSDTTTNMICWGGVCAPTAADAVLNVGDLETLLASGDVTVTTTGSGVEAKYIDITAPLTWSSTAALSLDAYSSIHIGATLSVAGTGGLNLASGDGAKGGDVIYDGGNITFTNVASALTIRGMTFVLVNSIQTLASAVKKHADGHFALANTYDASGDGTYSKDPIASFLGSFDGVGNTIANLAINDSTDAAGGLFTSIGAGGVLRNIALSNASLSFTGDSEAGIIAGESSGTLQHCSASGAIVSEGIAGALVGNNRGIVKASSSTASVNAATVGGLVGENGAGAGIYTSFASGAVVGIISTGGLVGQNDGGGFIESSHATGPVSGSGYLGGLSGMNSGWIANDYATGSVTAAEKSPYVGGLVGLDLAGANISESFANNEVTGASNTGGFTGAELGTKEDSYATGAVAVGQFVGGFVGCIGRCDSITGGTIHRSYSIGTVTGNKGGYIGGFAGLDETSGGITGSLWDITTSGRRNATGNRRHEPGLTGRTTTQIQAGLPKDFNKRVWAENPNINNGFPYLIHNPPPQ